MAAYAALVSLMNDLELISNHPTHSFSFKNKQITSLSQTVHFLIDFMETYDSHGCTRDAAQVLENQIAYTAHAAHDVIESHIVDQIHAGSTLGGKAISCFLPDLQEAIDNLDLVKREAMELHAKSGFREDHPMYSTPTSSEALTSRKNVMVGFDTVLFRLMDMLTGGPSSERVIPIVGMGGIGKTTLARNAFEHSYLEHHFDLRIWATISQEYSLENILTGLLFEQRKSSTLGDVAELGEQLHKKLWGRRYLIILDDMWSLEAWDKIQMFLPNNGNGSRVIVTTRLSNLAAHLSMSPFEMKFLDDEKSWELFCVNAFGEEENCPDELEKIGKKIVRRCRGLPLSIIVIGGYLRRRSSKVIECWEKVSNFTNLISNLGETEQCLEIISLSYEHMPARLKPCFLYVGISYEDELIDASQLLKYWVVEGFLKPKEGRTLEEVAEDCLEDLIERNLILVRERRWNGKVLFCGVHDIVRELCLKISRQEKFMCVVEDSTKAIATESRRIVIPEQELNSNITCALKSAPLVRSLIRQRAWFFDDLVVELRLVRLLANVNNMLLKKDEVCSNAHFQQVNLRYLDLSRFISIAMRWRLHLPSSMSLFWNLQTLILKQSLDVPASALYEIWEMSQLRHLEFDGVCLPDPIPHERSKQQERIVLKFLHTLLGVVNLRLAEEVCERMPNIKKLSVKYYHFRGDCEEPSLYYCLHKLDRFSELESLKCEFNIQSEWHDAALSFRFPSSITELSLQNCSLY